MKADAQLAAAHPQVQEGFCGMTIKGVTYDEKKTAGERLVLACSELPNAEEKVIGSYRGFELSLRFDTFRTEYQALLKGSGSTRCLWAPTHWATLSVWITP